MIETTELDPSESFTILATQMPIKKVHVIATVSQ